MATPSNATADDLFQRELASRSYLFTIAEEGLYQVQIGEITATIKLENVRRNYERDNDAAAIARFAKQLDFDCFDKVSDWEAVQSLVRYSIEPADYESGFDDTLHESVTDALVNVFVFVTQDGARISWITHSMLADWKVTRDTVVRRANAT